MSTIANSTGRDLWSKANKEILRGTEFNDVLHATHNGVEMTGGLGKDHYHVRLITDAAFDKAAQITDFNASQSDRLIINGLLHFDKEKVSITQKGDDYNVFYDGKWAATVNLQYTNADGRVLDWNPDLEQAKTAITKMIRGSELDGMSGHYYGN